MNPSTAEKILTFLLRFNAIILCTAFFSVFLPTEWMDWIHQKLGMGQLPHAPITQYLTRSLSGLYAAHGVLLLVIVWRPRRYWELIPVIAVLHGALGLVLLIVDINAQLPWFWVLSEGPPIMAFAGIVFWLWKQADNPAPDSTN